MTMQRPADRIKPIIRKLKKQYPDATCSLTYENPLQLLVATILSAQCTDARVNEVTKSLFQTYRDARDYAEAKHRRCGRGHPTNWVFPEQNQVDPWYGTLARRPS